MLLRARDGPGPLPAILRKRCREAGGRPRRGDRPFRVGIGISHTSGDGVIAVGERVACREPVGPSNSAGCSVDERGPTAPSWRLAHSPRRADREECPGRRCRAEGNVARESVTRQIWAGQLCVSRQSSLLCGASSVPAAVRDGAVRFVAVGHLNSISSSISPFPTSTSISLRRSSGSAGSASPGRAPVRLRHRASARRRAPRADQPLQRVTANASAQI